MPHPVPKDRDQEPERHNPQRVLVTVISLAFSVVGVALIAIGDPGSRVTGVIAVVFFGGLGLVYWGLTVPGRQNSSPEVTTDNRAVYPNSSGKAALYLAGTGIFTIVGGAMALGPTLFSASILPATPLIIVGVVCVLFFGSLAVFYAGPCLIPGGLVLTTDGITYHSGLGGFSGRWRDIEEVRAVNDRMLAVRATSAGQLEISGLLRLFALVQRRFWDVHVAIPLLLLHDPASVETAVGDFRRANDE